MYSSNKTLAYLWRHDVTAWRHVTTKNDVIWAEKDPGPWAWNVGCSRCVSTVVFSFHSVISNGWFSWPGDVGWWWSTWSCGIHMPFRKWKSTWSSMFSESIDVPLKYKSDVENYNSWLILTFPDAVPPATPIRKGLGISSNPLIFTPCPCKPPCTLRAAMLSVWECINMMEGLLCSTSFDSLGDFI